MARLGSGGEAPEELLGTEVQNRASGAFDSAGITVNSNLMSSLPAPRREGEAFEIPSTNNALDPGVGKTQSIEGSEGQTKDLIAIAKGLQLEITPFVHAALLHAGKKISPQTPNMNHSTVLIFSFRDRCVGQPPSTAGRAAALRIGFWPVQVNMSDDFQRTACRLKYEYNALHRYLWFFQGSESLACCGAN
ncbi:hypothetical protein BO71DRAFT_395002 [Aspergillus ellipticus CBS 707.79]|uniref:Uncharacterized protein n=1 Tax=Aspergillus ellipticus CBS 707.79 TaxID=1448320 RepID=A0A319DPT3_9EURO|nr:hypothetical protein BO71DRAFT_395002 [Aspergillus ellipticus CBS 707.79]